MGSDRKRRRGLAARLLDKATERARDGAANALEIWRTGGLVEDARAAFEVVARGPHHALRRYGDGGEGPALLLVPPLMVTSEIYDISPELSAVAFLAREGVDPWVVDFGRPEDADGGMERTLDDHVLAVVASIDEVYARTGRDVHLAGYSQGGLFCYQAAAYARSARVASVITFGSPVDLSRNLPVPVREDIARRVMGAAGEALAGPLDLIDGLPGALTSNGFKILSARKEVQQLADFARSLHDREALERREPRRRFLNGEGFVSWPGPALKQFVDELVTGNRLAQGGMVVAGESISLDDLTCPILYFVGTRDDLARPASVRSVRRLAPAARIHEREIESGHFGLVVGSRAMGEVWPDVVSWARDVESGELGAWDAEASEEAPARHALASELWMRLGEVGAQAAEVVDTLRWRLPRVAQVGAMQDDTPAGPSHALLEGARATPDRPFLLWSGRARTWAQTREDVDALASALARRHDVARGDRVALVADDSPEAFLAFLALSMIGAVTVVAPRGGDLEEVASIGVVLTLCDDASHEACAEVFERVLVVGSPEHPHALRPGLPGGAPAELGRAEDVCAVVFTAGGGGRRRPAIVTNRRWTMGALGAAAACALSSRDTVWCGGGLDNALGLVVGAGAALVSGARLALTPGFDRETFWVGVRRAGVTVVYAHGEVAREVAREVAPDEHAVRAWCAVELDARTREVLTTQHGIDLVAHVYATTEAPLALANLGDSEPGSVGQAPPGMHAHRIVRVDGETGEFARDAAGRLIRCASGEVGALVVRLAVDHPVWRYDGFASGDPSPTFSTPGGRYLDTGDLARANDAGDVTVLGPRRDAFRVRDGAWFTRADAVAALRGVPGVREVAAWREGEGLRVIVAPETVDAQALRGVLEVDAVCVVRAELPRDSAYRLDWCALRGVAWE